MRPSHTIRPVFDDPNLVSAAGLVPVMRLGEAAGLFDLLAARLSVDSPSPVVKTASVIGGMLTGADCIDDLDLLRHGGMGRLFGGSGRLRRWSFLRSFTHGHVQQLDAVGGQVLAALAQQPVHRRLAVQVAALIEQGRVDGRRRSVGEPLRVQHSQHFFPLGRRQRPRLRLPGRTGI